MSLACYPQPGKAKSLAIMQSFARGCGGRVVNAAAAKALEPGAAAFFGVVGIEHLFRLACAERREWWYGDNSFFDVSRGNYFRFAKNQLQISKPLAPDHARLKALGVQVKPWTNGGAHIVIIEQSPHFMQLSGAHPVWLGRLVAQLRMYTDRPLLLRRWSRNKANASVSLQHDLKDAWALVTYSSAAANEALIAGVPAFVGFRQCAAAPMAAGELSAIESPARPDGREEWAAGLAASQWTLSELADGAAWKALQ